MSHTMRHRSLGVTSPIEPGNAYRTINRIKKSDTASGFLLLSVSGTRSTDRPFRIKYRTAFSSMSLRGHTSLIASTVPCIISIIDVTPTPLNSAAPNANNCLSQHRISESIFASILKQKQRTLNTDDHQFDHSTMPIDTAIIPGSLPHQADLNHLLPTARQCSVL